MNLFGRINEKTTAKRAVVQQRKPLYLQAEDTQPLQAQRYSPGEEGFQLREKL